MQVGFTTGCLYTRVDISLTDHYLCTWKVFSRPLHPVTLQEQEPTVKPYRNAWPHLSSLCQATKSNTPKSTMMIFTSIGKSFLNAICFHPLLGKTYVSAIKVLWTPVFWLFPSSFSLFLLNCVRMQTCDPTGRHCKTLTKESPTTWERVACYRRSAEPWLGPLCNSSPGTAHPTLPTWEGWRLPMISLLLWN